MVSYKLKGFPLRSHSKGLSAAHFMGFSRQLVFGESNRFNGSLFGPPTTTVTSEAGGPGTASERIAVVLIGDLPVPESTFPNLKTAL